MQPLHQVWYWSSEGVKRYWADNTLGSKKWFGLALWTRDLKINSEYLLIKYNLCTKFGIDQVKGSKDFVRTTHWARKSGLTLTIEHLTWKSIEIIYSLRATPAPSLVLIKWRDQKILTGQDLVYRPTDRPTDRPTVPPFSRGHKNIHTRKIVKTKLGNVHSTTSKPSRLKRILSCPIIPENGS